MVSNHKKEYEFALNIINTIYKTQRNYVSMLETPFDVYFFYFFKKKMIIFF